MFCPNCKSEYREGFTECADCELPLVAELGVDPEIELLDDQLVSLHETGHPDELGALLELLESGDVPYVVHAGTALALFEGRELGEPGRPDAWQARILVSAPHRERARRLVAELRAERASELATARRSAID